MDTSLDTPVPPETTSLTGNKRSVYGVPKKPHAFKAFLQNYRTEHKDKHVGVSGHKVVQEAAFHYNRQKNSKR